MSNGKELPKYLFKMSSNLLVYIIHGATLSLYFASVHCVHNASNSTDDEDSLLQCCEGKYFNPRSHLCCSNKMYTLPEAYNLQSRWKCCGSYMYDSEVNECCDSRMDRITPKSTLAPNTGCCGPMTYSLLKDICCIESIQKDFKYTFYVLHNVSNEKAFCCGDHTYEKDEICCSGRLYTRNEYSHVCAEKDCICCGTAIASKSAQICCDFQLHPRHSQHDKCCGSSIYDSQNNICCNGKQYHTHGSNTIGCCGKEMYNKEGEECCNEKIIAHNSTHVHHDKCCHSVKNEIRNNGHISKDLPVGSESEKHYYRVQEQEKEISLLFSP